MRLERNSRKLYAFSFLLLLLIEISIARWAHDNFVRPYLGDFLVVILIYCLLMAVSKVSVLRGIIMVLIFSFAVEFFQMINYVKLLQYQPPKVVMIILGHDFSVIDLGAYSLGLLLVFGIEFLNNKISVTKKV